jgi:hypothetical protein
MSFRKMERSINRHNIHPLIYVLQVHSTSINLVISSSVVLPNQQSKLAYVRTYMVRGVHIAYKNISTSSQISLEQR